MITIKIAKPEKLTPTALAPLSGFITFPYDGEIVQFIKNLGTRVYSPDKKSWEVPCTAIPNICNKLTAYDVEIVGELAFNKQAPVELPAGFTFKTTPYRHQIEGVLFGLEHESFLLGDDQGLGKTKQIIDLALARRQTEGMKHCLIICGVNGNKYNWVDEIHTHSSEDAWVIGTRYTKKAPVKMIEGSSHDKLDDLKNLPKHFFIITNIETLRALSYDENKGTGKKRKKMRYPVAEQIQLLIDSGDIGMVAFDEAHKAKNPLSQQGEALLKIKPKYPIPMSGTFLMNNPLDLYLPLCWAGYEQHNFYQYKQHYCRYGGYGGQEIIGYKNLDELRDLMTKVMLRRTKHEVLDLPPKVHVTEYVDMSAKQKAVYEDVRAEIKQEIDKLKVSNNPLAQMIRLRQATGHPSILSSKITESAKIERMEEIIDDIVSTGEKCIVFSQWEQITSVARFRLQKYCPAYITGDVKSEDRMSEISKFQNDPKCKVIIGTIGAMGTGITLTAASTVIFLDEPWNRALKDQAEDRAHRIGTKGTVRVVTLICKETIDERIFDLVYKKGKMADLLIDGKMEVTNKSAFINYMLS